MLRSFLWDGENISCQPQEVPRRLLGEGGGCELGDMEADAEEDRGRSPVTPDLHPCHGSESSVLAELRTEGLGRALRVMEEMTSTIDMARQWLKEGAPNGAVVIAGRQTAGRGRMGRTWASPAGGLWLTVILRPRWDVAAAGLLGLAAGLAAAEAVEKETGAPIQLRWPNDLLLEGRKVGGVLVETELEGRVIAVALVSIGVNVNFRRSDLPEEVRQSAETLLEATGREQSLARLAARFLETLESGLGTLTDDSQALQVLWRARDALRGRQVRVEAAGKMLRGRAAGVDRQGRLLLATSLLGRTAVATGEVTLVREEGGEGPQVRAE
jgi:BirA family biotin operon repressor/biotin-[acetyl-CoA-carboxylase] ligase